jgi:hypothetical protein
LDHFGDFVGRECEIVHMRLVNRPGDGFKAGKGK